MDDRMAVQHNPNVRAFQNLWWSGDGLVAVGYPSLKPVAAPTGAMGSTVRETVGRP
jgi:hypothetical protein